MEQRIADPWPGPSPADRATPSGPPRPTNGETKKQIGEELGITGQAVGDQLKTIIKKCHEEVTKDE